MPPKPPPDENLSFLWTCLKNSDYKKIDMHAVAKTLNIKPGAAGTRFYRLKQRLDPDASTVAKGAKRNAEELGMDGEEAEEKEEESPKKKKRATAKVEGKGKGMKAEGGGEMKVKEEVNSDNEAGNGEEGGEGDGDVLG